MKRILCIVAAAAMLSGCASRPAPEPVVQTKIVSVPTPVNCKPAIGADPSYPDTDDALAKVRQDALAAAQAAGADETSVMGQAVFDGTKLLLAGRKLRIAREAELKAALQECAG